MPLFIGATLLLAGVILKKYMGVSTPVYLIISLAALFCCIQFAPDPCQAFYWWNGSVYYTAFYALAEILFCGDMTGDPDYIWSNLPLSKYYHKNFVIVNWS